MSLNDFFAKQNKKKSKKKQNPTELMDLLTKGGEVLKSYPESNAPQENKPITSEKDDEWEIIDDEKEIDLQNIRVYNLSSAITDDSAKNLSKNKDSREGDGESVVEKKVWGAKPVETPEEPVEAVVQPPPKPSVYIPAPLRLGGSGLGPVAPKPNVASSMDFPTLDASVNEPQKKEIQPNNDNDDKNSPWQQAGVRRANPISSTLQIAVNTTTSAYVPPSLRQAGAAGFKSVGPGYTGDGFRPHNVPPFRSDIDPGFRRFTENPGLREAASGGGWARGNIISVNPINNPAEQLPPNPSDTSFHTASENTNGWSRNVNVKTYKDVRETPGLEIDLKNRFTAFNET
ncbi:unnamed protein product [Schistosoma spindalis]|nr:unnamed protein product [Schistosoma spindale]